MPVRAHRASVDGVPIRLLTPDEPAMELLEPHPLDGYYHVRTTAGEDGYVWSRSVHVSVAPPAGTAPTVAEKGLPDWVIQAQVGHVAPEMMKTYSHIRREALNQAAAALEPTATSTPAPPREHRAKAAVSPKKTAAVAKTHVREKRVMSQSMSQLTDRGGRLLKFPRENGSPYGTSFATG